MASTLKRMKKKTPDKKFSLVGTGLFFFFFFCSSHFSDAYFPSRINAYSEQLPRHLGSLSIHLPPLQVRMLFPSKTNLLRQRYLAFERRMLMAMMVFWGGLFRRRRSSLVHLLWDPSTIHQIKLVFSKKIINFKQI